MRGKQERAVGIVQQSRITPAGAGKTRQFDSKPELIKDHPRRCGENKNVLSASYSKAGSPPQVRGKLNGVNGALDSGRITPAGAGKTGDRKNFASSARDHPRRCGENILYLCREREILGSPPQVRGKQTARGSIPFEIRITPAGAGKTGYAEPD